MKNTLLFLIWLSLFAVKATATTPLSKEAEISILTCSPGSELYSLFGHTAIRVNDPQENLDIVFNYGTFDFATPGFYLKYAQGLLPYQLTISSFPNFMDAYRAEGRTVYSQALQLDSLSKQKLFGLLVENYQPANRSYLYNFLFDNCTTRSRDIVLKSVSDSVSWQLRDSGKNFWNLLDEYLRISPWVQWGIHTILGQPGTRQASTFEYMFLPDYLMYGLDSAFYQNKKLVDKTEILYQAPELQVKNPWYKVPFFIFLVGTVLLIVFIQIQKRHLLLNIVSFLLFAFTGILGVLIVFLGFFTEHPITFPNWSILWANPLNLIVMLFVFCKRLPVVVNWYLLIYLFILAIAIPVWFLASPAVPMASISLIILMIYLSFKQRSKSLSGTNPAKNKRTK